MTAARTDATSATLARRVEGVATDLFGAALPVRIRLWDGSEAGPDGGSTVVIRSPQALRRLLWNPGELGVAQAYVTGDIDVEGELGAVLRQFHAATPSDRPAPHIGNASRWVRALPAIASLARDAGAIGRRPEPPASQARIRGRLHTPGRDRAVISHHYDLSNEFYSLILDPQLVYSCGHWADRPDATLDDAQIAKLDLVCTKLELRPGQRLLDIGCGWGALALHAAREHGVEVTGVTLSHEQARFARKRVAAAGVESLVEIRLVDYRALAPPPYDAVSSIEMGEHVGDRNYHLYAATLHRMVRPGGRVLVQQMSRHHGSPGGGPFIESFIAPDMTMRPVGRTVGLLEDAGLEILGIEGMRRHYVRTIEAWHDTFEKRWDEVVALVGEEVARVWRLYLVGAALSFEQGRMGVDQILAVRPERADRSTQS